MKQDIIINSTTSETRIALLEDDQLVEIYVERPENERMVGSLYKGVVRKVLVGMSAAFVNIGFPQDAFLHFSDVGTGSDLELDLEGDSKPPSNHRRRWEGSNLKVGQEVLVQVIKESIGHKGPRVSTQISLPGRFLVVVPKETYIGVSKKKIRSYQEKRRLRQIAQKICPKGFGLIMRTQAESKSLEVLQADFERVYQTWQKVLKNLKTQTELGLVYRDMTMASSIIRDLFTPEVSSLLIDSRKQHREILNYVRDVAPNLVDKIHYYNDRVPIFDKHGVELEIEKSLGRKIWLNGGGYLFFDQTEALIAIDVNSGRFVGKRDHEENSLKVNLKAAREICRQLRLRDIGGIIVNDFIDMADPRNRDKVFEEMTRQRIRPSLLYTFRSPCPHCEGTGLVPSMETIVTTLERWIKRFASHTREKRLGIFVNPAIKAYLSGGLKSRIARIMWNNRIFITMEEDDSMRIDEFRGYSYKRKQDVTSDYDVNNVSKS